MREVALFVEDYAHRQVVGAAIRRLADEGGVAPRLDWRTAVRGHGTVVDEFNRYLRDLARQGGRPPDLIVVATDANCKGLNARAKELGHRETPVPVVRAIPDPHVERWLLLDGAAFKDVFGQGCDAPDMKCSRDRYKQLLVRAIRDAGVEPSLGGIEYARDIVERMDIDRAARADRSFGRFVEEVRAAVRRWQS